MTNNLRVASVLVALLTFGGQAASATPVTIDFGGLVGANEAALAVYGEDGFTVTPVTAGTWFEAHAFGNPVPSIFAGPIGSPGVSTIDVTGGLFSFVSVDLSCNNGSACGISYEGFLSNVSQFSFAGDFAGFPGPWETENSVSGIVIDSLRITLDPDQGATSMNLDNVVLDREAVPEPATLSLVTLGLIGGLARARRRAVR